MLVRLINSYIARYNSSQERTRRLIKNIFAGFFIKGGSIIIMLLLVPLTIDFVDVKQYGIWLTLSSIIGWASFFDVGLGHGLRNRFAEAIAQNQNDLAKHYVSSAYFILGGIVFLLAILFTAINPHINWATVLAAPQDMSNNLSVVASIVVYSFLLQLVLKLITSMLMASQFHAKASMVSLIGNILSLAVIFIATKTTRGNLFFLAAVFSIIPTMVLLFYNIYFFSQIYKEYIPSLHFVRNDDLKSLFGIGALFFIIQIAAIVQFQTANILIAHWISIEDVTVYNICYKYFSVLTMVFSLIISPYWSAFTEAYVRADFNWIRLIINKTRRLWFFWTLLGLLALVLSPFFYKIWIGDRVSIPFYLSFIMTIYIVQMSYGSIYVSFINGIGRIKVQTITSIFSPLVFIGFAFLTTKKFNLGIVGIVLSSIIANFYGLFIAPLQYKKIMKL